VASVIHLADEAENFGAMMIIQAARKQVQETGDGTTLAVILAYNLVLAGKKAILAGYTQSEVRSGIMEAVEVVCNIIEKEKRVLSSDAELEAIATIAANNDSVIGKLIASAVRSVGKEGEVLRKKSINTEHSVEYTAGYQWDYGIEHEGFANIGGRMMKVDRPLYLVTDHHIADSDQLIPIVEKITLQYTHYNDTRSELSAKRIPRSLIVICPACGHDALGAMIRNIAEKEFNCYHIKPSGGLETDERKYAMKDIAALTGAKYISMESGVLLKDITLDMLGSSEWISSYGKKTIIFKGAGEDLEKQQAYYSDLAENWTELLEEDFQEEEDDLPRKVIEKELLAAIARVPLDTKAEREILLEEIIKTSQEEWEKKYAERSLAKLRGGIATVMVGGKTLSEQKELFDRVDDSVSSCKAAMNSGIVRGGGVAMLMASADMELARAKSIGHIILKTVLISPITQILGNAGVDWQPLIISGIQKGCGWGYDIKNGESVDMFDISVVDPFRVITSGLRNAASVAVLMLNTDVVITDAKEKDGN